MDHPDAMMQGMLLAWVLLLVVPTTVIGATVIWYVRHERARQASEEPLGDPRVELGVAPVGEVRGAP